MIVHFSRPLIFCIYLDLELRIGESVWLLSDKQKPLSPVNSV